MNSILFSKINHNQPQWKRTEMAFGQHYIDRYEKEEKERKKKKLGLQKMKNERPSLFCLLVSDVHLGARRSQLDEFIEFLEKIKRCQPPTIIKYLIIIGDFFDLMFETPYGFYNKNNHRDAIKQIFSLLNNLKMQVQVINIIGNHEISPKLFNSDKEFPILKEIFFEKFKRSNSKPEYLEYKNIWQYALLNIDQDAHESSKVYQLEGYDRIEDLKNSSLLNDNYCCLILHGCQFDMFGYLCRPIWRRLIKAKRPIKRVFDILYNGLLRGGLTEEEIYENKSIRNLEKLVSFQNSINNFNITFELSGNELDLELSRALYQSTVGKVQPVVEFFDKYNVSLKDFTPLDFSLDIHPLVFEKMKDDALTLYAISIFDISLLGITMRKYRIRKFIEKHNLFKISAVLYGHTHKKDEDAISLNNNKSQINIFNDGNWQHKQKYPNYMIIRVKENLTLKIKDFKGDIDLEF